MTIIHNAASTVDSIGVIHSLSGSVRQLAINMIVDMAEGNLDMIQDMAEEYSNKNDIENALAVLNDQALDMLPDLMRDLETSIKNTLEQLKYTAKVSRMDYDDAGELKDVTVKLNFE
jgi:hypothetical protein